MQPTKNEIEDMLITRHTFEVHKRIKNGKVAIAGLGGLGSHVAIALVRMGIETLHLIDFDTVDLSNLNRQEYRMKHIGMPKTEALKQQLLEINPYLKVHIDTIKVTPDNIERLFAEDEIVCEAFDDPTQKAMLIGELLGNRKDVIVVSGSGMAGYGRSNEIITKKINDHFYICGDGVRDALKENGLMASRVFICAGHQANKIIELLIEKGNEHEQGR